MRAVVVDRWMDPAELSVRESPEPQLGPGEIEIEVRAAGCNFFDILMVQGRYQVKPPFPFVLGGEVAGVVSRVSAGVSGQSDRFEVGDPVFGAPGRGCYAERVAVAESAVYPIPSDMTFEHAAALPTTYPTSYAGLVYRANLEAGETLLVHAAAGGVGSAAVQIGKALGARVIATAGGADKLEVARRAGADVLIDYRKEDFVARVKEETDGRGADVIYDSVGGDTLDRSLKCIAWNGRLVVVGFASGEIPKIAANRILLKNIAVTGVHWGAYAQHEPSRVAETFVALFALYDDGRIDPLIYDTYPMEDIARALGDLGSRKTYGKLIVTP